MNRFMITVDDSIADVLTIISQERNKSIHSVIKEIVEEWIDLKEDFYLTISAEKNERDSYGKPRIKADAVWQELNLK